MLCIRLISPSAKNQQFLLSENKEYLVGRDESNDIIILDTKISRKHARIFFEEGTWYIERLSQVGKLYKNSLEIERSELQIFDNIQIANHNLIVQEGEGENEEIESIDLSDKDFSLAQEDTNPPDAETTAGASLRLSNFLRITYQDRSEELLKLEGDHWVLGRSDECDLVLKDVRASRKHIVLSKKGIQFYVKDLGSSNGSYLNGNRIPTESSLEIQSGDYIELGSSKVRFEVRNPQFEDQLDRLPVKVNHYPSVLNSNSSSAGPIFGGQIVEIKEAGPLGFIIPDRLEQELKNPKKKKLIYAVSGVLFCLVLLLLMDESEKKSDSTKESTTKISEPFEALSEEQKLYVRNTYDLAYQFYTQGQYELALGETEKIHNLLPEGYIDRKLPDKNSKVLEKHADTGLKIDQERTRLREIKAQRQAFDHKLQSVIDFCKSKESNFSSAQMENCLSMVLSNRPNDPQSMQLIEKLKNKEEKARQAEARKLAFASKVESGEDLYQRAVEIDRKGNLVDAIQAYEKHKDSVYPDPKGLKRKSSQRQSQLQAKVKDLIDKKLIEAQGLFEADRYKECIETLNEVLRYSPKNPIALERYGIAKTQLHQLLKKEYQDSIFKEAHGEIEDAKRTWKNIMKSDVKGGEYYNKAEIKLKRLGFD